MSDFTFGKINKNTSRRNLNLKRYESPLLVDYSEEKANYNSPIVFLVEEQFEKSELSLIHKFLVKMGCTKYKIINAINCEYNPNTVKDGVIKFYKNNVSNFYDYIPQGAPIITSGPALYSLIQEDDIYPNHAHQLIFGKSSFWFSVDLTSKMCHRVFPIDSFKYDIFGYEHLNKWNNTETDSYRTKIAQIQIMAAIKHGDTPVPRYPKLNKIFIENKQDFIDLFYTPNKNRKNEIMAWDLETSGLNFYKDKIGCITVSFGENTGYYIPWRIMDEECKKYLGELFKNNIQCLANGKFDIKFCWKNGVSEAYVDEDIILLSHSLDAMRSNSLKSNAFWYSIYGGYERPLDEYKSKIGGEVNYLDIPETILRDYAVMDAIVTWIVYDNMIKHCREVDKKYPIDVSMGSEFNHNVEYYYRTFRIPASNMYARIEYEGVYVDKDKLDIIRGIIQKEINILKEKLNKSFNVPKDFQWESGQKLGQLLESKGWEDYGRTKAGDYATGDFQISRWKKNHPEAKDLEKFKSYNTILNTFVGNETKNSVVADFLNDNDEKGDKGWTQYLQYHKEDNTWRMHPTFLAMMADSGRSKCKEPNLQQVPSHSAFSEEVKSCLLTPNTEDYYLCTVDYSSLQIRIAGIDIRNTKDPLVKILQEGKKVDLHSNTAHNVFFKDKEVDVDIITVEQDGKTYKFLGGESVMTTNGEKFACELTEEDTIIM